MIKKGKGTARKCKNGQEACKKLQTESQERKELRKVGESRKCKVRKERMENWKKRKKGYTVGVMKVKKEGKKVRKERKTESDREETPERVRSQFNSEGGSEVRGRDPCVLSGL